MKVIFSNLKKNEVKLKIENMDDLWYLSHIIELNDHIKGATLRKISIGSKEERAKNVIRKPIFAKIKVEKIDMSEFSNLRVSGIIVEAPEEVPKGNYHTFNLEENSIVTIIKEKWQKYHLDKLKEASKPVSNILICIMDREEAVFALLKKSGYNVLSKLKGIVNKKAVEEKVKENFYSELIKKMKEYDDRYEFQSIILASPSFWKEDLMEELKGDLKDKIILATCSSVDESSISEVLKRQETQFALKQDRITKETNLVDELLLNIKKDEKAAYGLKEVELAVNSGAVDKLLVTDRFIMKSREDNKYYLIDELMKKTDYIKGEITIISSEHDAGKKLDGLGGVGAILRYKLRY